MLRGEESLVVNVTGPWRVAIDPQPEMPPHYIGLYAQAQQRQPFEYLKQLFSPVLNVYANAVFPEILASPTLRFSFYSFPSVRKKWLNN